MTTVVRACSLLVVLLACLLARPVRAQVDLQMSVSSREVAVGENLQVRLDAMSTDEQRPTAPELVAPDSFEMRGPSIGTRQQVSISGFNMVTQTGISATWVLTPTRPGLYTIGPASVEVEGRRQQASPVQVRVLAAGQRRPRARRAPLDPFDAFDPFGDDSPFDDLFDRLRGRASRYEQLPEAPPLLVPARVPDELAFVRAHVDRQRAVVGQQVTLAIYAHGSRGIFQEAPGAREPSHPDFLAQRLVEDGSRQPVYQYVLDGRRWVVVKVREIALFPLRSGRLEIGALEFGFLGRRYGVRDGAGLRRSSGPVIVDVSDPPLAGRPPGFRGDVGQFELSVDVEPRAVPSGGSIAVTARVRGQGRLPGALQLPERTGVEWLEPTITDDTSVTRSMVGGVRTFSYLVRLTEAGALELGALALPFYDPEGQRYQVARAELGTVQIEAAPAASAGGPGGGTQRDEPRLSELFHFRGELREHEPPRYLAERPAFWWLVGAGPVLAGFVLGLVALGRRARRSWQAREQSQATRATRALVDAKRALAAAELANVASAVERAIYTAIEWATGLKVRAVLRSELAATLERAGLPAELCRRSARVLERCGELRLSSGERRAAQDVIGETESLVRELVRRRPRRSARGELQEVRS